MTSISINTIIKPIKQIRILGNKKCAKVGGILMKDRSYLIVHGYGGSGPTHWQAWLYNKLTDSNEKVYFPSLPNPNSPDLNEWIAALKDEIKKLEGEKFVICHSLGTILWLHYANLFDDIEVDHLLFVAPPGSDGIAGLENVSGFLPIPLEKEKLFKIAKDIRLVCSETDEFCVEKASIYFGETLEIKKDILPDEARHINIDSGYGPWPDVEKWCQDPTYRLKK